MRDLKTILLVEDNPNDVELTLEALDLGYFWAVLNEPTPLSGHCSSSAE